MAKRRLRRHGEARRHHLVVGAEEREIRSALRYGRFDSALREFGTELKDLSEEAGREVRSALRYGCFDSAVDRLDALHCCVFPMLPVTFVGHHFSLAAK